MWSLWPYIVSQMPWKVRMSSVHAPAPIHEQAPATEPTSSEREIGREHAKVHARVFICCARARILSVFTVPPF